MNAQLMDQARAAYRAGDFSAAAQMFASAKTPDEICGEADHLRGNSLMRLGLFRDAAEAYAAALRDASYGKTGALLTNQGKALAAVGDLAGAANSFGLAVQDSSYATPYKAYMGLGNALLKSGNPTDAGVAFRSAAIDGANPAPAAALMNLGDCFLLISRPEDAVEAYRTALDFVGAHDDPRAINAGLGQALAAAGRHADAIDAFGRATSDGIYQLTPEQQQSLAAAQDTLSAQRSMATVAAPQAPGAYAAGVDPLDPLGQSGNLIPDPSDTGFFTLSESEMIQQDKKEMKVRRRHRHLGLKIFLVILLLLLIAAGGLGFAYTRGYGYPTQQDTLTKLFEAVTNGTETDPYLASGLSDDAKSMLVSSIPEDAVPTIQGLDRSMTESTATVSVELSKGGSVDYTVDFVREGIGWAVSGVSIDFGDADSATE